MPVCLLLTALCAVGCSSYENRSFQLTVKNESNAPVTVWLTKNGPPDERNWQSPESYAISSPKNTDLHNEVVLDPGKEGRIAINGKFRPSTDAVLRVYDGVVDMNDMIATDELSSLRHDARVPEGIWFLSIQRKPGLTVVRTPGQPVLPPKK
jgi:hypothetical protein